MENRRNGIGHKLKDIILGGQDGLVNVLGVILAVASATNDSRIVIIAGLAATFAESISMAAVAYTSSKAERDYYESEVEMEKYEIEHMPQQERKEIRHIFHMKGFRGKLLDDIVKKITSSRKLWLDTMMKEELNLHKDIVSSPGKDAFLVGFSALVGSVIPLASFLLLPVAPAIVASLIISTAVLFVTGAIKAKITVGHWIKSGLEMAVIGMAAAIIGYAIGAALGVVV